MMLQVKKPTDAVWAGDPAPLPDFDRVLALAGMVVLAGLAGLASILLLGSNTDGPGVEQPPRYVASTEKAVQRPSPHASQTEHSDTTQQSVTAGPEPSDIWRTSELSISADFGREFPGSSPDRGVGDLTSAAPIRGIESSPQDAASLVPAE